MNEQDKAAWLHACNEWHADSGGKDLGQFMFQKGMELRDKQAQAEPVEFEYPDFHGHGMGCGLEDRGITDRYDAMKYGWDEALEKVFEMLDDIGPLYTRPHSFEPVAVVGANFNLFWLGSEPVGEIVRRHNIKVGSKLYAEAPAVAVNDRLLAVAEQIRSDLVCEVEIESETSIELSKAIAAAKAVKGGV